MPDLFLELLLRTSGFFEAFLDVLNQCSGSPSVGAEHTDWGRQLSPLDGSLDAGRVAAE